jgi:ABC-type lipoprotein release transport system permease subunit
MTQYLAVQVPADAGPQSAPLLCLLMMSAAGAATFVPARRALRISLREALRAE